MTWTFISRLKQRIVPAASVRANLVDARLVSTSYDPN